MSSYTRSIKIPDKSSQELFDVVSKEVEHFMKKNSFGKYEIDRNAVQKEIRIKTALFSATLRCHDSEIELTAELSLMATPFKSKLDSSITTWISKTFG
jgi:hypothetical protein